MKIENNLFLLVLQKKKEEAPCFPFYCVLCSQQVFLAAACLPEERAPKAGM